jgi:hypothetical protein
VKRSKSDKTLAYRIGVGLRALILGFLLAFSIMSLVTLESDVQVFRYQGF